MNKRGFELTISTVVVLVLGILVLIGLFLLLSGQFKFFSGHLNDVQSSDVDNMVNVCNSFVSSQSVHSYCCDKKYLEVSGEKLNLTCDSLRTKSFVGGRINSLDCGGVGC